MLFGGAEPLGWGALVQNLNAFSEFSVYPSFAAPARGPGWVLIHCTTSLGLYLPPPNTSAGNPVGRGLDVSPSEIRSP